LTAVQVLELRHRYRDGESVKQLAREVGISSAPLFAAVTGITWQDVADPVLEVDRGERQLRGSALPFAKMTEATVAEARRRHQAGEGVRPLARAYDVSPSAMRQILNRTTWQHVT
jgi:hypothetical protein